MDWGIVVPIRNRCHYLRHCLNSIDVNRQEGMHVLVIDNASDNSDEIYDIVDEYVWMEYHRNSENLGLYGSVNNGLNMVKGDWLHILHEDDWILPGFYETVEEFMETGADIICTEYRNWHENEECFWGPPPFGFGVLGKEWKHRLRGGNPLQVCAVTFSRETYNDIGEFSEDLPYAADWEWYLRALNKKWAAVPIPLAVFRVHGDQDTTKFLSNGQAKAEVEAIRQAYDLG